jgi:hypothetical protein
VPGSPTESVTVVASFEGSSFRFVPSNETVAGEGSAPKLVGVWIAGETDEAGPPAANAPVLLPEVAPCC